MFVFVNGMYVCMYVCMYVHWPNESLLWIGTVRSIYILYTSIHEIALSCPQLMVWGSTSLTCASLSTSLWRSLWRDTTRLLLSPLDIDSIV